jgi:hypothetical protein
LAVRLLNLLTTLSLLLCVAVVAVWVRSYSTHRAIWGYTRSALLDVGTADGRLVFVVDPSRPGGTGIQFDAFEAPLSLWREHPWVSECTDGDDLALWPAVIGDPGSHPWGIVVPFWIVAAVLGWMPACTLFHWLRRTGQHLGSACAECGYDLRATPDRCPECGEATA